MPNRPQGEAVQAPGCGLTERISRSIAVAGSDQSISASATVILGARLTPSADCGTAITEPSAIPSMVATSNFDPETESRSSRVPAVSVDAMASVTSPYTGPVSSPASSRKVVAPVKASPARTAACTGAAPRQAGSREKCRLTQPWVGMSNTGCRRIAP